MSTPPEPGTTSTGLDLQGAVWIGAELDEVAIEGSDLRRLRAAGGTWTRTSLLDCTLEGADLAGLVTTDSALVRCTLDGARLTGSQWLRARWRGTQGRDVVADEVAAHAAVLTDVTLVDCRLRGLNLEDARLDRVRLIGCDLSGARFAGARCRDVELQGCTLTGATGIGGLRGSTVGHADAMTMLPELTRELGLVLAQD